MDASERKNEEESVRSVRPAEAESPGEGAPPVGTFEASEGVILCLPLLFQCVHNHNDNVIKHIQHTRQGNKRSTTAT